MKPRAPNLEIYSGMPDSTLLSAAEVMKIFNYKSKRYFNTSSIPTPIKIDAKLWEKEKGSNDVGSFCKKNRLYWRLGDLRRLKIGRDLEMIR